MSPIRRGHGGCRSRRFVAAVAAAVSAGLVAGTIAAPTGAQAFDLWSLGSTTVTNLTEKIGGTGLLGGSLDGTGVGVALVDTGVVPVPGLPAAKIVNGPDLSVESQVPQLRYLDTYGHGTHMAGIIVGNDATASYKGVAPGARLTSVKVGGADGAVDVSQVIAAVDWVVEHRLDDPANPIRVLTLAYGTDGALAGYGTDPLSHAVENAWRAGIVVVTAAGNAGATAKRLTNPAVDPFVLSVASVNDSGLPWSYDNSVSTFSSSSTGRKADIAAPGEGIVSLRNPGSTIDTLFPSARVGEHLFRGSGTSQAAAIVAGAVALLLQKRPSLTPDQVKALLRDTADPLLLATLLGGGIGQIDLGSALTRLTLLLGSGTQRFTRSTGTGPLDGARGTTRLMDGLTPLTGNQDLWGAFTPSTWAAASAAGTSWQGGSWLGRKIAGDGWTGTSWASRTWAPATWAGTSWSGRAWTTDAWTGRYWSGRYWSSGTWSGRYWSSSLWTGTSWTL